MRVEKNFIYISVFVVFSLILAACAPASTPEPTQPALPTITEVVPTETNTPLPTSTATIAPTATVTLEPTPDLSGIEVLGAGPDNGFYLVNFYKPGIEKEYLVQTDSGIPFKCDIYKDAYPDRLICHGPMLSWGQKVQFSFIDPDTAQTVYTLDYVLPDRDYGFAEKKMYWCVHPDACPLRGQQMNCETEIRKDSHGKPCLWSTCMDLCGYCTSINTCDNQ